MKLLLPLLFVFLGCSPCFAAMFDGTVIRTEKSTFLIKANYGGTIKMINMEVSQDLLDGKIPEGAMIHSYASIKPGYWILVNFTKQGERYICTGIRIVRKGAFV